MTESKPVPVEPTDPEREAFEAWALNLGKCYNIDIW